MFDEDLRHNPYVGLRPFFKEDSLYFFGRDEQTAAVLDILRRERFVGVVGSSGSGKSSLVRAGVLPSLLGGFLVQDRDRWRIATLKPGDNPLGNLAEALLECMGMEVTLKSTVALRQEIADSHAEAVVHYLSSRLETNANLFLLVDQFEEIFAFRSSQDDEDLANLDLEKRKERARRKAEAADFVDLILTLSTRKELPIYVVLTMRTDFLGDCDVFYSLPEALNRGRYLVPRLSRDQLREAVECPARLLGVQIGPRLLDHVLNQLGDRFDRLPVLQHALLRTWDAYQTAGGVGPVDLQHYEAAGELEGALNQDAEAALEGLSIDVVSRVFKRLTDTDAAMRRVRCPARISQLQRAAGAERREIQEILHHFSDNDRNFVRTSADGNPNDLRVDISHESLLRQWGRLRDWMDEEQRSRDQFRGLVEDARRWKRNEASLLRDPELQQFVEWQRMSGATAGWAERYTEVETDFDTAKEYLSKSIQQRDAEKLETARQAQIRFRRLLLATAAGILICGSALFAYREHSISEQVSRQRDAMERSSNQLRQLAYQLTAEEHKAEAAARQAKAEEDKAAEQEQKARHQAQIAQFEKAKAERRALAAIDVVNKLSSYNSLVANAAGLAEDAKNERDPGKKAKKASDASDADQKAKAALREVEASIASLAAFSSGGRVVDPSSVSLTDLFDLSQGIKVTGSSAPERVTATPAMFGANKPSPPSLGMTGDGTGPAESVSTFFRDKERMGAVHWVSWELPQATNIGSVALFARYDLQIDGYQFRRAISEFNLYSKSAYGEWNKLPLLSYKPSLPYGGGPKGNLLAVCLPLQLPSDAPLKELKAEFVQAVDVLGQFSAPRIIALDGYADSNCGGVK